MTQHYRLLTKEEIARLEAQHCIASDWSGVEVADDFHTDYIHHTRFSGKVRLGVFEKSLLWLVEWPNILGYIMQPCTM